MTIMEFIFELFAEMLGREEERQPETMDAKTQEAEVQMEGQQADADVQPVNIFNVVNFH